MKLRSSKPTSISLYTILCVPFYEFVYEFSVRINNLIFTTESNFHEGICRQNFFSIQMPSKGNEF